MSEDRRVIPLQVTLDHTPLASETSVLYAAPGVLSIVTMLFDHDDVLIRLVSTFIAHQPADTQVVHVVLAAPGESPELHAQDPEIHTEDHPNQRLDPTYDPRGCAYHHIHALMERVTGLGHELAIDLPDDAFDELERDRPR
jgi:hypothetical protein